MALIESLRIKLGGILFSAYNFNVNRIRRLFAISLVFLLLSCNFSNSSAISTEKPAALVTIKTNRDHYSYNDAITIIITNDFSETVEYYGSCSLTLCQFTDGDWICQVKDCNAPKDLLPPGSTARLTDYIAGSSSDPFRYQFEYFLPSLNSLFVVYSNEFSIEP